MKWIYNDGGRAKTGYTGFTSDCATRAISIVTGKPYISVYEKINEFAKLGSNWRVRNSTAMTGVYVETIKDVLKYTSQSWVYVPVKVRATDTLLDTLPKNGVILVLNSHVCAMIDGVIHDTFNPFAHGNRKILWGFYTRGY